MKVIKFSLNCICFAISLTVALLFCLSAPASADSFPAPLCVTNNLTAKDPTPTTAIIKPGQSAVFANFSFKNNDTVNCPARLFSVTVDASTLPAGWTVEWLDPLGPADPINFTLDPEQTQTFAGVRIIPKVGEGFGVYNIKIAVTGIGLEADVKILVKISDDFTIDTTLMNDISIPDTGGSDSNNITIVYGWDEMINVVADDVTPVTFSLSGLPAGATSSFDSYSLSPAAACVPLATGPLGGGCARKLTITIPPTISGVYLITETVTNGYNTHLRLFNLNVTLSPLAVDLCGSTHYGVPSQTCNEVCASFGEGCVKSTACIFNNCRIYNCDTLCIGDRGCECSVAKAPCVVTDASWNVNSTCTGPNGVFTDSCASPTSMNKYLCGATGLCELNTGSCIYGSNLSCTAGACSILPPPTFAPFCNNGMIETGLGETCDFSTAPSGCAAPLVCNANCTDCIGGPCDGYCPANSAVAQDPDCGCQNGNGCCGIGCNNTIDNDCPNYNPPCGVTGGLVPCGRLCDDLLTPEIDESQPCSLCAMFYMLERIIDFTVSLGVEIAVLALVIAGLLYVSSGGDAGRARTARSAATNVVLGFALVLLAWLVVHTVLRVTGYINFGNWNRIGCELPSKIIYTQVTIPAGCNGPSPNFNDDNCTKFNDAKIFIANIPHLTEAELAAGVFAGKNLPDTIKIELDANTFNQYGALEILSPNGVVIATLNSSKESAVCASPAPIPIPVPFTPTPQCPYNNSSISPYEYYNAEIFPNSCGFNVGCQISIFGDAIKYIQDPLIPGNYLYTSDDACWRLYDPSGALKDSHDFTGNDIMSPTPFIADLSGTWTVELDSGKCASFGPVKCYSTRDYSFPNPVDKSTKGSILRQDITDLFNDTTGVYTVRVKAFSDCKNAVRSASANLILTIAHRL